VSCKLQKNKKLYYCVVFLKNIEKGVHCTTTINKYIIAGSEEEAKKLIINNFNLNPDEIAINARLIRRCAKNKKIILDEWENNLSKINLIKMQNDTIMNWYKG
jgi:hypothetical protein